MSGRASASPAPGGARPVGGGARPVAPLAGALAGILLGSACLDFAAPVQRVAPGARLQVHLALRDGRPPMAEVRGLLFPPAGDSAAFSDTDILVDGLVVAPVERADGSLYYERGWVVDSARLGTEPMEVRGPWLPGAAQPPALLVPIAWRAGADSVAVGRDEDLLLPLRASSPTLPEEVAAARWRLSVHRLEDGEPSGGPIVFLEGRDAVPPELVLPAAWLGDAGPRLRVLLRLDLAARLPAEVAGYPMDVSLNSEIVWLVERP